MKPEYVELRQEADNYAALYKSGKISREEAIEHIQPYIDAVNKKAKELAIKYNQKYKPVSIMAFLR